MLLQVLPEGFALPPLPYLLIVLGAAGLAVLALVLADPSVTEVTVVAFAPWMVAGATLYALNQVGVVVDVLAPLFGSPTVYVTTFSLMGFLWGVASLVGRDPRFSTVVLLLGGIGLMSSVLGLALVVGLSRPPFRVLWPAIGFAVAVALTGVAWMVLGALRPRATSITGMAGLLAVFGHTLDGVSTAVGVDVLHFGEQTPLSAAIIEVGASLPTAPYLGTVWLFVLVKVALAMGVVVLMADYVEEAPREGFLLLAGVAAVGLGPGAHNLVLFSIAQTAEPSLLAPLLSR
ncbi:DUF63 family protein [Halomarina litorea]|uniref:DUF63 family protein n=1 Tax=Halomarina litorea TaxID=2961595 RepID=UPI0020C386D5|nr:DUF63 family protein [Halomarina sp. BCD28]